MLGRSSTARREAYEAWGFDKEKSDNHSCLLRDTISYASADESNHPSRHLDPHIGVRAKLVNTCTNAGYQLLV
jgi:hypothetical protein